MLNRAMMLIRGKWLGRVAAGLIAALLPAPLPAGTNVLTQVPGDYDGDRQAEFAVYEEATGTWAAMLSSSSRATVSVRFGGPGAVAVPGDYDGDRLLDPAHYTEASGAWSAMLSGAGYLVASAILGGPGWQAAPADYDGDGFVDPAVFLAASNTWQSLLSGRGYALFTCTLNQSPATNSVPDLGANASLRGRRPFPDDNPWNRLVENEPVDPNSDTLIDSIGRATHFHPDFGANWNGGPFGIPYIVVAGSQARVPITYTAYGDESDPGPFPVPPDAPIEGGASSDGDRHVLVIDRDGWMLYELYRAFPAGAGWEADSGAKFDFNSNALRPAGWTSADAAGLPIFPGLVRYDEVFEQGEIRHALRFTCSPTRRAYIAPARHYASSSTDPSLPPMGLRVRLKASVNIAGFPAPAQVILLALKRYGMLLADNGSDWFVSGMPDARWNDDDLNTLKNITGNDFEVVKMGEIITD